MKITKAIIPAAGLGTRFLPFTKAVPKELLPLLNKPAIQYIIEEGIKSCIKQFTIIVSHGKEPIAHYLNSSPQLKNTLQKTNRTQLIASIDNILQEATFNYIYQNEPLGLGHAIKLAQNSINQEYFSVLLPDDILISTSPGIGQLADIACQKEASILAVQEVPLDQVSSYGIVAIKKEVTSNLYQVAHVVEKPSLANSPSNLAIVGRYVLSHKIFNSLDAIGNYACSGELHLTNAIDHMLKNNERVFAVKIQGSRYDIGTPLGWLKGIFALALQDPEYASHIQTWLDDTNGTSLFPHPRTNTKQSSQS